MFVLFNSLGIKYKKNEQLLFKQCFNCFLSTIFQKLLKRVNLELKTLFKKPTKSYTLSIFQ